MVKAPLSIFLAKFTEGLFFAYTYTKWIQVFCTKPMRFLNPRSQAVFLNFPTNPNEERHRWCRSLSCISSLYYVKKCVSNTLRRTFCIKRVVFSSFVPNFDEMIKKLVRFDWAMKKMLRHKATHRTVLQVKMERSGQRWSNGGCDNMIKLRDAYRSQKYLLVTDIIKKMSA